MIIPSRNILDIRAPKTFLNNGVAATATTYPVKNTTALTNSWAVQIGETGEEQTEVVIGTATNIGTITGPALSFSHPADTPVYFIKYDQVVFERSTAGTAGTAIPMTAGTVNYQADGTVTQFDDTSGSSAYAYKTFFRSSSLAVNSTESSWITSAGFSFYSLARLRERIKRKLWSASYISEDTVIDDWINEWKDEMSNAVISVNEDYSLGTVNIPFGTDGLGTISNVDFKFTRRVWITYNGVNTFRSTKMSINDFSPNQIFSSAHPYHAFLGDTVIQVKPSDTAGTIGLVYYKFGGPLVSDTDELPQSFRSYTKSFVDYGLAQAATLDDKFDKYDRFMDQAEKGKIQFVTEMSPRDVSGPILIDLVEPISGDNGMDDMIY